MTSLSFRPISSAIASGGRGLTTVTIVPIVVRTLESTSVSCALKAAWRIDVYNESSVVLGLNRVFPSGAVLSGSFKMTSNRCSRRWVLLSRNLTVATA